MAIAHDELILKHALKIPKFQRVLSIARENCGSSRHLRETYELEAHEVLEFIEQEYPQSEALDMLVDAVYERDNAKQKARLIQLVGECMGDITADHLCELRDLIRALLIDYTSHMVRNTLENEQ